MSHNHASGRVDCLEIGPDHCLQATRYQDGRQAGFIIGRDAPDLPHRCEGFLTVALPANPSEDERRRPTWTQIGTLEGGDLTLSPSVLCMRDQDHGYVRAGHWVPA